MELRELVMKNRRGVAGRRYVMRAVAAAILVSGCATSYHGLKSRRGSGDEKSFPGTPGNAWRACILGMLDLGLQLEELDPDRQYVMASHGTSMASYGENIGCFVRADSLQGQTLVEIVSQRVVGTNAFAKDWSADGLWAVGVRLSRLESEKSGPWLQATDVDACVDDALAVARREVLEISWEEEQRCRKDAKGSDEREQACLAERKRVRGGWIVYADPETVQACLEAGPRE